MVNKPTANITVNKSRLKIYNGNTVYLNDGDCFQFELFNPTQNTVLASISIDGKKISQSGIVLNPGQRVFLDRYLDKANKFKFSTYEVESNNAEVAKAIEKNGLVKVDFYDEVVLPPVQITTSNNITWVNSNPFTYTNYNYTGGIAGSNVTSGKANLSQFGTTVTMDSLNSGSYEGDILPKQSAVNSFYSQANLAGSPSKGVLRSMSFTPEPEKTLSMETGKIEAGESSSQRFTKVNKDFNTWASASIEYKILPQSQQPIEAKDAAASYCPSCGKKVKSNWKFCTKCGEKLD